MAWIVVGLGPLAMVQDLPQYVGKGPWSVVQATMAAGYQTNKKHQVAATAIFDSSNAHGFVVYKMFLVGFWPSALDITVLHGVMKIVFLAVCRFVEFRSRTRNYGAKCRSVSHRNTSQFYFIFFFYPNFRTSSSIQTPLQFILAYFDHGQMLVQCWFGLVRSHGRNQSLRSSSIRFRCTHDHISLNSIKVGLVMTKS